MSQTAVCDTRARTPSDTRRPACSSSPRWAICEYRPPTPSPRPRSESEGNSGKTAAASSLPSWKYAAAALMAAEVPKSTPRTYSLACTSVSGRSIAPRHVDASIKTDDTTSATP